MQCLECGAEIFFQNIKPDWKIDRKLMGEFHESRRFVDENKNKYVGITTIKHDKNIPRFAVPNYDSGRGYYLAPEPEYLYFNCPVCDSKVYKRKGRAV